MIWNYSPHLETIEETQVNKTLIGEEKRTKDVLKPYRLLIRENDTWTGTNFSEIDEVMGILSSWQGDELRYVQSNLTEEKINSMVDTNGRMTFFFQAEVPIGMFSSVLPFSQKELPEMTFNRLIMDWSKLEESHILQLFFVSEKNRTLYSTNVSLMKTYFDSTMSKIAKDFQAFQEIEREGAVSLYVPANALELVQYTYYIDEIPSDDFRNILFNDPSIVKKNNETADSLKYTDGMSLMTVDTKHKTINYVDPAAESIIEIPASRLLYDSFDFINDHGGINGDFRYVSMSVPKHITEYQLFLEGLPVYSNITSTRITTTWGDHDIFRYKRPYYLLAMDITSEKVTRQLPSGPDIVDLIQYSNRIQLEKVDDIVLGYYLSQNTNFLLYTLEPSWFVISEGSWKRLTPDMLLGGVGYGLE